MATDVASELAQLRGILNAGTGSITVDGQTVTFHSPDAIRLRIRELEAIENGHPKRPKSASIYLGGF